MKFLIASLALIAVVAAQQAVPVPIAILRQSQDISPEGSYQYAYDTENGIHVDEAGQPGPQNEDGQPAVVVKGSFAYTGTDGAQYTVTYTADENGFHPEGAHLPVAPPVPEEILRSLEYNKAHPEEEESEYQRNGQQYQAQGRRYTQQ